MHGRPRRAPKPEEAAASAAKTEKLRALQAQFLSYHHNKTYTKEAVELSGKLLEINPESYTAWNYRKLAVEHNLSQADSDPDSVKSILDEELRLVEIALRQNFKSYAAWHHRKWVLSKGHSSIGHELRLLDKFQRIDPRNFHAWNYRRFVAALMNRTELDELKYTEDMIYTNFSNYSAWHNRSILLSNLLEKKVEGFVSKDKVFPEEYEFIHQAVFTDPDDQSGWFYHLWLLDQTVKTESPLVSSWPAHGSDLTLHGARCMDSSNFLFTSCHFDSGALPLILHFNQAVGGVNACTVRVESGNETIGDLVWEPLAVNNSQISCVWVTHLNFCTSKLFPSNGCQVKVSIGHSQGIFSSRGLHCFHPSQIAFTMHVQPVETGSVEGSGDEVISWTDENFHIYEKSEESNPVASFDHLNIKNVPEPTDSDWRITTILKEIECFRELLSLTESKIGKLTLARLLIAHDEISFSNAKGLIHLEEVLGLYNDLMKLDPSHYQYYKDEHSLALLRQVTTGSESLMKHCFNYCDLNNSTCLRLNHLSLSRIGSFEKLLWVQMLDLSHNDLQSIEGLEALQLLSCLNLSCNKFSSFTALQSLRQLTLLKVLNISHNQIGEHSVDLTRYLCSSPLSHSVGSEWLHDEIVTGGAFLPSYWEVFFVFRGLNLKQLDVVGNVIANEKFKSFLFKMLPTLRWLDGELC